ncbi:hypothetical protein D1872_354130 [compost metagenome]
MIQAGHRRLFIKLFGDFVEKRRLYVYIEKSRDLHSDLDGIDHDSKAFDDAFFG